MARSRAAGFDVARSRGVVGSRCAVRSSLIRSSKREGGVPKVSQLTRFNDPSPPSRQIPHERDESWRVAHNQHTPSSAPRRLVNPMNASQHCGERACGERVGSKMSVSGIRHEWDRA